MKKFRKKFILWVFSLFLSAIPVFSEAGKVPVGFVANGGNNHVQVIDLSSGKTLTKLYTGAAPWRLVFTPDQKELWVQHWYSETTVAVDLPSLIVAGQIPERGPGIFNQKGDRFWTYSWPGSIFQSYDTKTFETKERIQTEVKLPYELAFAWGGEHLYVGSYDPVSKGDRRIFNYVLTYPMNKKNPGGTSIPTGDSPARMKMDPMGEFLVISNLDGNEVTLINQHNARAKISLVPNPRDVVFISDSKIIALCWKKGEKESDLLTMDVDWKERPWPDFKPGLARKFRGGLVSGQLSPSGKELIALDQVNKRLVFFNIGTLEEKRSISVGDVPFDFLLTQVSERERDRWGKKRESQIRLEKIIQKLKQNGEGFRNVHFVERFVPAEKDVDREKENAELAPPKKIHSFFKSPDRFRQEFPNGGARLAEGGHAITITPEGKYYNAPRQDLFYLLFAIHALPVEQVIQHMAGDVPGSPFLKNGIAVDVLGIVQEGDHQYHVIGAKKRGEMVSHIWIEAKENLPVSIVEKFPMMSVRSPHETGSDPIGITETKLHYEKINGKYQLPSRMLRLVAGKEVAEVFLEDIQVNPGLADFMFDLKRLGGLGKKPDEKGLAKTVALKNKPGKEVPGQGNEHIDHPLISHVPYNSNPPTSGPHTRYLAAWGVHEIPIPLEEQVHNLEDGGVVLQYNCPEGCPSWIERMEKMAEQFERVVVAPYPMMDSKLALTAWERIELLNDFNEKRIIRFIETYIGIDHHPAHISK